MSGSYVFPRKIRRVAVIGAGATGLICAKTLVERNFEVVVFERNDKIGGTWVYSSDAHPKPNIPSANSSIVDQPPQPPYTFRKPPTSSIYETLHTNLPTSIMQFSNDPFPSSCSSFPHHPQVLSYLTDFAEKYNITPLIHFSTELLHMDWSASSFQWTLTLSRKDTVTCENFDAVSICTGHYYIPYIPAIPGLETYPGTILHSKDYRTAKGFHSKNVLVIGNAYSAHDILRDLHGHASSLHQSIRTSTPSNILEPEQTHPIISEVFTNGEIWFADGTKLSNIDTLIFATGYLYSFPFLSRYIHPTLRLDTLITDGQKVYNLYKHLFFILNPTLAFIGLPMKVSPLPLSETQSMAIATVWAGDHSLPREDEMRKENGEEDVPKAMQYGVEKEVQYVNGLRAWWSGKKLENWWIEGRREALERRKKVLGY